MFQVLILFLEGGEGAGQPKMGFDFLPPEKTFLKWEPLSILIVYIYIYIYILHTTHIFAARKYALRFSFF